MSRTLYAKPG
jgi:hypothetical protein